MTDPSGTASARTALRAVSPTAVRIEDRRDEFAFADRHQVHSSAAVRGVAVRVREVGVRPAQTTFREHVGRAWSWRSAITGEAVREALDAAHLPGSSWRAGGNAAVDGVLLRADLRRLLDARQLRIESAIEEPGLTFAAGGAVPPRPRSGS